jgi:hypothetical protein
MSEMKAPVIATVPVHGKYVRYALKNESHGIFIVAMASMLILNRSVAQNSYL